MKLFFESGRGVVVAHDLAKVEARVQFPSPAPSVLCKYALLADGLGTILPSWTSGFESRTALHFVLAVCGGRFATIPPQIFGWSEEDGSSNSRCICQQPS